MPARTTSNPLLRLATAGVLAGLLLFAAGCGQPPADPIVRAPSGTLVVGQTTALTVASSRLSDGVVAHVFVGVADGTSEVEVGGATATVPIAAARSVGSGALAAGKAEVPWTVPLESTFSGKKLLAVAVIADGDALLVTPIAHTEQPIAALVKVGPSQPLHGETVTISLHAKPRAGAIAHLFMGRAAEATTEVRAGVVAAHVPLTDPVYVGARAFGKASITQAIPDDAELVGHRLAVSAVIVEDGRVALVHTGRSAPIDDVLVTDPVGVLAVLLAILALLFAMNAHPTFGKVFKVLPLLVFAYFVPTIFSNTGVIPIESDLYGFIKTWLLPASLILLTLSVDIPAIVRLGRPAVGLFLTATITIVIGGPIAYLLLGWMVPESLGAEAWKGLAALSGSWIGGTANMVAIGESVGVSDSTFQLMIVVDVAVANVWMAVLLYFAGREKEMDLKIGADRSTIDACRKKVEDFQAEVLRPTTLADLLLIVAIAIGGTFIATRVAAALPDVGSIVRGFTWVVILVTTMGVGLSFTPLRRLEGAGASKVGSLFLYLLVASIGAHAEFKKVVDAPALVAIGALWMAFHAVFLLLVRRIVKAPIFFAAVGSKANIGGAASAPIVAAAFHPALAPVGILLAVAGYVLGTYAGLLCAAILEVVHGIVG